MEREFEPESLDIVVIPPDGETLDLIDGPLPRIGTPLLLLMMVMPWFWVYLGLTVMGDYRLTIVLYELLGCALPVLITGTHRLPSWPLRFDWRWLLLMGLTVASLIIIVFRITNGFGMDWSLFHEQAKLTKLSVDPFFWVFAVVIVLINPFLEEAFWRGLIYRSWKNRLGTFGARWISSFFFGAWHWVVLQHFCNPVWAIVLTLLVMMGGWIFCILYENSRTLAAPALLHGIGADLPMIYVVYDCVMHPASYPM